MKYALTAMRLSAGGARRTASNCCASAGWISSSCGSGGRGGGGRDGLASAEKTNERRQMSKKTFEVEESIST